jgi:hypothetical protein
MITLNNITSYEASEAQILTVTDVIRELYEKGECDFQASWNPVTKLKAGPVVVRILRRNYGDWKILMLELEALLDSSPLLPADKVQSVTVDYQPIPNPLDPVTILNLNLAQNLIHYLSIEL